MKAEIAAFLYSGDGIQLLVTVALCFGYWLGRRHERRAHRMEQLRALERARLIPVGGLAGLRGNLGGLGGLGSGMLGTIPAEKLGTPELGRDQ